MKNSLPATDEETIKKYSPMVYKIAYSATSSRADSDDIFQDVFLRYIRKRPTFKNEEHEKAWFIRVAVNCSKSFLTQAWNKNTQPLSDDIEYRQREAQDIDFAMRQLSPKGRTMVYLYYYEGYSSKEIAEMLNMNHNSVRVALKRARGTLKSILESEGYDDA